MGGLLVLFAFFVRNGRGQFHFVVSKVEASFEGRAWLGIKLLSYALLVIIRQTVDVFRQHFLLVLACADGAGIDCGSQGFLVIEADERVFLDFPFSAYGDAYLYFSSEEYAQ